MSKQPLGPITTLLDLTDRDFQDDDLFPLETELTWFNRDRTRKTVSFSPQLQTLLYNGPAAFGQRFTFNLGSTNVGDVLFGAFLEIKLGHWLDAGTRNRLDAGIYTYTDPQTAWEYANSLGTSIIESAELEIDGVTVETIDGDFINTFSLLSQDYNSQFGIAYDHIGRIPISILREIGVRNFPTEDGTIHCPLPFFFGRVKYQDSLPLIAIKEGICRIHIILRPFSQIVRQVRGWRNSCDSVPLQEPIMFTLPDSSKTTVLTGVAAPALDSVTLLTHGAILDGELRQTMLRKPFEIIHRALQTFTFDEPLKYLVSKKSDAITIQLPLEANHPVEEIIWYVRRKGVSANNEWTNYSDTVERAWTGLDNFITKPMLINAKIQVNGITLIEADEQYFRQHIARKHKGGYVAYSNYVYGFSFAETPGEHQPTGSVNISRANSLRLTLDIYVPGGEEWEVKVFTNAINWMRFENGLANAVFED